MRDGGTGFDSRTCADPCGRVVGADGSLEHTAHRGGAEDAAGGGRPMKCEWTVSTGVTVCPPCPRCGQLLLGTASSRAAPALPEAACSLWLIRSTAGLNAAGGPRGAARRCQTLCQVPG